MRLTSFFLLVFCLQVTHVNTGVAGDAHDDDRHIFNETESNETQSNETQSNETQINETQINESQSNETQINETQSNETQNNETPSNETQINETQSNETQINESQSNETQMNETQSNETQINETQMNEAQNNEIQSNETLSNETQSKEFIESTRAEGKISDYILNVIKYYKQPNPEGLPSANLPDPYYIPDTRQTLGFGSNLEFTDTALHGVNKFRVLYINADFGNLECHSAFEIDKLQVRGKYSLNVWLNYYPGEFVADIIGIKNKVLATLGVEQDGKLRAQNISVDITFKNITVKFENAGILASMFQGVFNSMGSFLYDSIRTVLVKDAHTNMRKDINKKLDEIVGNITFPNTISPVDMIMVDVRNKIKDMKMDPLQIEDHCSQIGIFKISLCNTLLKGLSTFHRTGNITVSLKNNTVVSDFNIGAKDLQGLTRWEVSGMNQYLNKTGTVSFSVKYIQARIGFALELNKISKIEFRDLQLDVGNIQIGSDGAGTLDYVIEVTANILPTLLRYQIIQSILNPVKWMIQQKLDNLNLEEVIINNLPMIDQLQRKEFQLYEIRNLNSTDEIFFNDEEFFNF